MTVSDWIALINLIVTIIGLLYEVYKSRDKK